MKISFRLDDDVMKKTLVGDIPVKKIADNDEECYELELTDLKNAILYNGELTAIIWDWVEYILEEKEKERLRKEKSVNPYNRFRVRKPYSRD